MKIAMIGATGLIGATLARRLVAKDHSLLLIGRRAANIAGATDRVVEISRWAEALDDVTVDVAISTLGTTRKVAGSMDALEAVDRHAVTDFARAAKRAGARQWLMVSSVGANPHSCASYLAVKGKVEADVNAIGFDRIDICRPGLLVGNRMENRPAERWAMRLIPILNPLLAGPLDRYRAIPSNQVAAAIAALVGSLQPGMHIHENRQLRVISGL